MDIEAIARTDAATKAKSIVKHKGYDDIVVSEYDCTKQFSEVIE